MILFNLNKNDFYNQFMKLILQSRQLLCSNSSTNDKIHIISQFFTPNDLYRLKEIQYALNQNCNNQYIHHIHLLNETYQ